MKRRKRSFRKISARRPPLDVSDILAWADAFHARVGRWPRRDDGKITGQLGLTWTAVNVALQQGHRGLPWGSTLAKLLLQERGKRHKHLLPRFTLKNILAWADAYHERHSDWPGVRSGPITEAPAETWLAVEQALRDGGRGLRGGSSLACLLARRRRVRNTHDLPALSVKQVLAWVDAHRRRTGTWPRRNSGPIWQAQGENWYEVGYALRHGTRGLPRCGSLARFLTKTRGARNHKALPAFSVQDILRWAVACHDGTGNWPTPRSGPVREAPGETWLAVDAALRTGLRGLPGGSSLSKIMRPLRHKNCM